MQTDDLYFSFLGVRYRIACSEPRLGRLLRLNYDCCEVEPFDAPAFFTIARLSSGELTLHSTRSGLLWRANGEVDDGLFIYSIEKDITLHLQETLPELYFIHAAALERHGRCVIITAASGTGKSTTTLALQRHGFLYLSDELAPIDLRTNSVLAYPHALCLKSIPPTPYHQLPEHFTTERTMHVPASGLKVGDVRMPLPLGALVFLSRDPPDGGSCLVPIGAAEATTRLYANTLNALAHANVGLDAAAAIAASVPGFRLHSADLATSCALLEALKF